MKAAAIAIAIVGIISSTAVFAEPLAIKGVMVDRPADCEYIKSLEVRQGTFNDSCGKRVASFMKQINFMDEQAVMYITQSPDGIVESVFVSGFNFEKAIASFSAKYGKPKIETSTIQNRMGAKFDKLTATWRADDAQLTISNHGARVNEPSLTLVGKAAVKSSLVKMAPSSDI